MLGNLFQSGYGAARQEELDNDKRLREQAAMDGFQADRYATYQGADLAGRGLGSAAASAAGLDPRTPVQRNEQAIEAAKAQVAQLGFNPDDPKSMDAFYKQVVLILQKQGLVPEAMAVAQEYRAAKKADAAAQLGNDTLGLKKKELERKIERDAQDYELGQAKIQALVDKGVPVKAASTIGKLFSDMNALPPGDPARASYKKAIENAASGKILVQDLGDHVQLFDATTRQPIRTDDKGLPARDQAKRTAAVEQAAKIYPETMAGIQQQYDTVVALHNHSGLAGITGPFAQWVGDKSMLGTIATVAAPNDARNALALYNKVIGGTFLSGLVRLKEASKTGASGLGSVSEVEGDKVQSDAAALSRVQQTEAMREQLATYATFLEGFAQRLATGAAKDGTQPISLRAQALTVPRSPTRPKPSGRPASELPVPPVTPRPASPGTTPTTGVVQEWERGPDGKLRRKQ